MIEDLRRELATLIQRLTAPLAYQGLYPGTVRAQDGDTVSVELDPPVDLPPLSGVPIRSGVAGVKVTVSSGARVVVTFERGDPSKPIAALWGDSSVTSLKVNGGSRGVARNADDVSVTIPPGTVLVPYAGPGPTPPGTPVLNTTPITVTGSITSASTIVRIP